MSHSDSFSLAFQALDIDDPVPTAAPIITSATYDAATGLLVVTGQNLPALDGAGNDIVANRFTFFGEGGATYTLADTEHVEITSATGFTLALSALDRAAVALILNKNGPSSTGGTVYNLAAADDWAAGAEATIDIADGNDNGITVSNVAVPQITAATFDAATGVLTVTGSGFSSFAGPANDIDATKLTITGEGGASYTLASTPNPEITSGGTFSLTLAAQDLAGVRQLLNREGTAAAGGAKYNLAAAEDWAAGADPAVIVADLTGNGIAVSNTSPWITSANITASAGQGTGGVYRLGDSVTVTWDAAADGSGDVTSVSMDFGQFGGGAVSATQDNGIWSATYVITTPLEVPTPTVSVTATNANGSSTGAGAPLKAIDSKVPAVASIVLSQPTLVVGDTAIVTFTFSEPVSGFDTADVTVPGGKLSALTTKNNIEWTATLTPAVGIESMGNTMTVDLAGVADQAGNIGKGSTSSLAYAVDTMAPTLASSTPAGSGTNVARGANLTLTFSEDVQAGTGTLDLRDAGGTVVESFDVATGVGSAGGSLVLDKATVTLDPHADLAYGTAYSLEVAATAFRDGLGNPFAGLAGTTALTFTTESAPPPPADPGPPPAPAPETITVDGVPVQTQRTTAPDGTVLQTLTVPVVTGSREESVGDNDLADILVAANADGQPLLQLGVAQGTGLVVKGPTAPQSLAAGLATLSTSVQGTASADAQQLLAGAQDFLAGAAGSASRLLVTSIVPSAAPVEGGPALQVTGAAPSEGTLNALVLDVREAAGSTHIDLDHVDFVAVIGAATLRGGSGSQVVQGDGAAQDIFLGEGDDVLYGGGGDDVVGSGGGNDRIYGDDGNDVVFGGTGDDFIDGGSGRDVVQLAGRSRADYALRFEDGTLVMTHREGGSDGTDRVANVEVLQFLGTPAADGAEGSLARLYDAILDRPLDAAGRGTWLAEHEAGTSLHAIAGRLLGSGEARQALGALDDAGFVARLYETALGRSGDAEGLAYWTQQLQTGALDRAGLALALVHSPEGQAQERAGALLAFDDTDVAALVRLYATAFGRQADEAGMNFWLAASEGGASLHDVAGGLLASGEAAARYDGLADAQYVAALYAEGLQRGGSEGEIAGWTQRLAGGSVDRAGVLLAFAESQEQVALVGPLSTSLALL